MMDCLANIKQLVSENRLEYAHYTLARFIKMNISEATEFCLWLSVLVNSEINRGNVCLELAGIQHKSRELGWKHLPPVSELSARIQQSPVVGAEAEYKPLVLHNQRLYLNRYYHNEKSIADCLISMTAHPSQLTGSELKQIDQLFSSTQQIDYQKLAAVVSARHQLSIISGGPGTGKTWTVSKILAFLLLQNQALSIKLAAPTGKAAARLSESILKLRDQLPIDDVTKSLIPHQAVTLHRLLGFHRYSHRPRFHKNNRLPCDVLVLDEASMIDQQMMAAVCAALADDCKLILLGDKDQLSSVEAGSVFADLSGGLQQTTFSAEQQRWMKQATGYDLASQDSDFGLADQLVVLQKSHRFTDDSAIGQVSKSVNRGDIENSLQLLKQSDKLASIRWQQPAQKQLAELYRQQASGTYLSMTRAESIQQAFKLFGEYQILAAVWKGPAGVDTINSIIETYLKAQQGLTEYSEYYAGKPLMMTSNVYQYGVHNGDIGIIWPDAEGELKIWFEQVQGEYRVLSLSQLSEHKSAYAITVHKSQGSEFKHVLLILPATESAVTTRELFYTGITRAAESVEIWASESQLKMTIQQKTQRVSGLKERLEKGAESTMSFSVD